MSLFECVDRLDERQNKLNKGPNYIQLFLNFCSKTKKKAYICSVETESQFINMFRDRLLLRLQQDDYKKISNEIQILDRYLTQQHPAPSQYIQIKKDLLKIMRFKNQHPVSTTLMNNPIFQTFQSSEYRIANINQTMDYRVGTSTGMCQGYTYAMVDPRLSPYKNPGLTVPFSKIIHDYQEKQTAASDTIKRKRITRYHFCADSEKRAKEILAIAEQNSGKELDITLSRTKGGHSVYLSIQADQRIRYMDANHGAYLFKTKQEWLTFFIMTSNYYKEHGYDYRLYSIAAVHYDADNASTEQRTLKGKIRTLLTGPKYSQSIIPVIITTLVSLFLITASVFALMWIVLPAAALSATLFIVAFAIIYTLSCIAMSKGHVGLLAIPHLFNDCWNDFKNRCKQTPPTQKAGQPSSAPVRQPHDQRSIAGCPSTANAHFYPGVLQTIPNKPSLDKKEEAELNTTPMENPYPHNMLGGRS